jgi:hypothetical protein
LRKKKTEIYKFSDRAPAINYIFTIRNPMQPESFAPKPQINPVLFSFAHSISFARTECCLYLVLAFTLLFLPGARAQVVPLQNDSLATPIAVIADEKHRCVCGDAAKLQACDTCFDAAHPILQTAYTMGCINKEIVQGSCWSFANEVYRRTAGPEGKKKIFLTQKGGPYASAAIIEPGDWIYHINYSYRGVDHSALFVCWTDYERRRGLTISYYGQNRKMPARIEEFDLKSIFGIFRMNETISSTPAP